MGIVYHSVQAFYINGTGHSEVVSSYGFFLDLSHGFRMPAFFLVAGFFLEMLLQKRNRFEVLVSRFKRVMLPFFIGIILLTPPMYFLPRLDQYLYAGYLTSLDQWINILEKLYAKFWRKLEPGHLWFLFYLFSFSILGSFLRETRLFSIFDKIKEWFFPLITMSLMLSMDSHLKVNSPNTFFIPWNTWVYYYVYFFMGMLTFSLHPEKSFSLLWTLPAFVLVFVSFNSKLMASIHYAFFNWCVVMSLVGLVARWNLGYSKTIRYISDSSYWLYLIHEVVLYGFDIIFFSLKPNLHARIVINLVATLVLGFYSYQFFVRFTWIGKLLNGKKAVRVHLLKN